MVWRIEVEKKGPDPEARWLEANVREAGLNGLGAVRITRVWYIEGDLTKMDITRLAQGLFCDRVVERWKVKLLKGGRLNAIADKRRRFEVLYHPGVTDPAVESVLRALKYLGFRKCRVRTGKVYKFARMLSVREQNLLCQRLLFNPLIQHLARPREMVFAEPKPYQFHSVVIRIRDLSEQELSKVSQERLLALSLEEMKLLRNFYQRLGRDPTDVELETFAQTWSEHCQHKTFRGEIVSGRRVIKNLLKTTIMRVTKELNYPWVLSAFKDNSGVIEFDDKFGITFKVETHNHPSALEPYGGAGTGIGGVIRDCLGTGLGAKPVLNTDVFCFGELDLKYEDLPEGVLHPRRVMRGVVAGVRDYSNRMGIPTANGAVFFDESFVANPLVFCGTLGIIPKDKLRKVVRPGQAIVLLGGRTGRDGIHGVTFASLELDRRSSEFSSGAVQIGNPIEEKKLVDLVLLARDRGYFTAITDCGGGGLSSAIGELCAQQGCEVWLEKVPLKYPGLTPAEVWISEAQERMVVFTEPGKVSALLALAREYNVEATVIGKVTQTRRLVLKYEGHKVGDIDMEFLHHGWRAVKRTARWVKPEPSEPIVPCHQDLTDDLRQLLAAPNIASKEWVTRQYDHEVQGGTILKPFCGKNNSGPTDACVIMPVKGSFRACVVACGLCPRYSMIDPYWMASSAIDEALRNCIAAGGSLERMAILDNFSWGNPESPEQLGALVRAAEGCYETARGFRVPFISGKDSLYNEFRTERGDTISIPGTLLISAVSVIPDGRKTVSADFKEPNSLIYLVGETFEELGGSEFMHLYGGLGRTVPKVYPRKARRIMQALSKAIRAKLVLACHDLAEGGLGVALTEMAIAGHLGATVELKRVVGAHRFQRNDFLLFSESNTRFLCEVKPDQRFKFEQVLQGLPYALIGKTKKEPLLVINGLSGERVVKIDIYEAEQIWREALTVKLN